MIKMVGTNSKTGNKFVLLGLTDINIAKMREGKPINIFGAEIGLDVDIVIVTGETEDVLTEMLKPFIDKTTLVTDHRGRKRN